jgi:hypothetical protein
MWIAGAVAIACACERGTIPLLANGRHRPPWLASVVQPDRFRTTDVRTSALNACRRQTYFEVLEGLPGRAKDEN